MNVGEAIHYQGIAAFLAGDVDHCDEVTRAKLATDLATLDHRAHKAIGAGPTRTAEQWDELLCDISFEERS